MSSEEMSLTDALEEELSARDLQPAPPTSDLHVASVVIGILGIMAVGASLMLGAMLFFCMRRQFRRGGSSAH